MHPHVDARLFGINAAVWEAFEHREQRQKQPRDGIALRFPGGSLADEYDWATNTGDGTTWPTSFTDFADVATAVGSQVFITVNYAPARSADAFAGVALVRHSQPVRVQVLEVQPVTTSGDKTVNGHQPQHQSCYTQMKARHIKAAPWRSAA